MGTYDIKKVLKDYEHGSMPVEMAQGHSLQHIAILYEHRAELRAQVNNLNTKLATLQADVDRLTALVKKP